MITSQTTNQATNIYILVGGGGDNVNYSDTDTTSTTATTTTTNTNANANNTTTAAAAAANVTVVPVKLKAYDQFVRLECTPLDVFRIQESLGSVLCLETNYFEQGFTWFLAWMRHDCLLSHHSQLAINIISPI
jgi:hypothetical protein